MVRLAVHGDTVQVQEMLAQGAEWGRDLTLADSDRQSVWPFRIPAEEACAVPRGRLSERSEGWARRPYLEATERDRIFDYHSCIGGPLAAQIENEPGDRWRRATA